MADRGVAGVSGVRSPAWSVLDPAVATAVINAVGVPMTVNVITQGRMHAQALHLVTPSGSYFFKSSRPRQPGEPLDPFAMTVDQAEAERLLPEEFPTPRLVAHGVHRSPADAVSPSAATAWLISDWVEGAHAYDRARSGTPQLADRLVELARRTRLPVTAVDGADRLPDVAAQMRHSYQGNWAQLAAVDCSASLWTPQAQDWARRNNDRLQLYERLLAPHLTPSHVISTDAHCANVLIADAGPATDVLIDGAYGRGPGWFTALTMMLDAQEPKGQIHPELEWYKPMADGSHLDAAMAAVGGSPELTNACLAVIAGHAIAASPAVGLKPEDSHVGPSVMANPTFLITALAARIAAHETDATSAAIKPGRGRDRAVPGGTARARGGFAGAQPGRRRPGAR